MADETRIDPDGARSMFKELIGIGADLKTALRGVVNIRSTVVEPWGNDEYGKPFAGIRETNAKSTLDGIGEVVEGLTDLGSTGRKAIDDFEDLDTENSEGLGPDR
ncbi:hypothetical protein O7623_18960 [Solwaraspora sp. WMMD791]|uniref:hypothetical protein n=1 Tax=Solwaraspora sp. WMMD791 TaxID=3016086 RepID=UPI00249A033C|nr:hypothetical protein [Solwaraspora sp. WMMD791]WFE25465.1 hypothetical protein O7623_18960 [Solwaraspora sp. WMMD791]